MRGELRRGFVLVSCLLVTPCWPQTAEDLATLDPYTFFKRAQDTGGEAFRHSFATGAEAGLKRSMPGSSITFDPEVQVDDLTSVMRVIARFRGDAASPGGGVIAIQGQSRQFFHKSGSDTLSGICFGNATDCAALDGRLDAAENSLRAAAIDAPAPSILPDGGMCQTQALENPATHKPLTIVNCLYDQAFLVSLARMDAATTREVLGSMAAHTEIKKATDEAGKK